MFRPLRSLAMSVTTLPSKFSARRTILAAVTVGAALAYAAGALAQPSPSNSPPSKGAAMSTVAFGKHSEIVAQPSEQGAIRKFYRDVLGVLQAREAEAVDTASPG